MIYELLIRPTIQKFRHDAEATIDISPVAQRMRSAGKDAAQFIRQCFEAASANTRTPTSFGPVPIPYPNMATAQRGNLPVGSVQTAETQAESALDATILIFSRALRGEQSQHISQMEALLQLMAALCNIYGLNVRSALQTMLLQAQQTFRWTAGETGARRDQMANFVLHTAQAAMTVFNLTPQAIVPVLFQVAMSTPFLLMGYGVLNLVQAVTLIAIILMSIVGYSGPATVVATALFYLNPWSITAALVEALNAGIDLEVIVQTGLDYRIRQVDDWADMVAEAWRNARIKPTLQKLVKALRKLVLSAERVASIIEKKCAVSLDEIADAIIAEFGRDASQLARALKAAKAKSKQIAEKLKSKLGSGASTIAQALKDTGDDAQTVTEALRSVGFSAIDAARALKDQFGADAAAIARALRAAQYATGQVMEALIQVGQVSQAAAMSILASIG